MKPWNKVLPEVLLSAAVVSLLVLAIVPARRPAIEPPRRPVSASGLVAPVAAASAAVPAEPEAIISLFYREPPRKAPAPPGPVAEAKPAAAPGKPLEVAWLAYVGYFSGADNRPFFYIKDTRSGRLIRIATGEASDWTLVEAAEDRIVVGHDGAVYAVARKR